MAKISTVYTIRNSEGEAVTTIPAGVRDESTSLVLHGRGAPEFGLEQDQNLVYLLENFSNSTPPDNPIVGQFWWDTGNQLFVWSSLGSPIIETWNTVVPPPETLGFNVIAGDGLINGGFPTLSPLQTVLDIGSGTGITINTDDIQTNDSEIIHDNLSGSIANEHINHGSVVILVSNGFSNAGTSIDVSQTFILGGDGSPSTDGVIVNANNIQIDSTVMRTTNVGSPGTIQTIGGTKTFSVQIRGDGVAFGSTPSYSFIGDIATGMYLSAANEVSFVTGGAQRFCVTDAGRFLAQTPNYEDLVLDDDDIPNKKYVDDTIGTGTIPTSNIFVGVNSLSGLDPDETYLVSGYGVTPSKGTGNATLSSLTVRIGSTTVGSGSIASGAQTPQQLINWYDGNGVAFATFVVDMSQFGGDTTLNFECNSAGSGSGSGGTPHIGPTLGSLYLTAMQITG